MLELDFAKQFDYENNFYLTAPVNRISKFAMHLELFRRTSGLAGDIVECGVFKGASFSRFIKFRGLFENPLSRKMIGFDTFGEYPQAQYEKDMEKRKQFVREAGSKSIEKERLIEVLQKLDLHENVELIEGDILKTVPAYKFRNPHLKISLLHIDVDLYEATAVCLKELYPLVVKGGIVILDDYDAFPGAKKAIDEFFYGKKTKISRLPYSDRLPFVEVK